MSEHNRPHIDITALGQRRGFKSPGSNARQRALNRVRADHGHRLIAEIGNAFAEAEAGQRGLLEQPGDLETAGGVFIEIELNRAAGATNLERQREGTRQAAEIVDENGVRRIALFVPDDMRAAFSQVFEDYTNGELNEKGSPPKKTRVEPIEHIRAARLQSFWRDAPASLPEDPQAQMWWALWCFNDRTDRVLGSAELLGLQVGNPDTFLHFPETTVIPAYGRRASIEILLFATAGISELRRASDSPLVFTRDMKDDVPAFIDDLAERVTWPGNDAPAVCLLDTGVNRAHPLIEPALSPDDLMAIDTDWGGDDHEHGAGHGTGWPDSPCTAIWSVR